MTGRLSRNNTPESIDGEIEGRRMGGKKMEGKKMEGEKTAGRRM